jgi:GAF domain-containing protein/HAMP domain-containing protein
MKADVDDKRGGATAGLTGPAGGATPDAAPARGASIVRSRLFVKYVALLVTLVALALIANGAFEVWFSYQENKTSLIAAQHQQAQTAADKIEEFITQIQSQVGWTTQLPWEDATLDQRRFDALRLLRQVPAITELAQIDATGHEQLKVSRLTMDVVGSGIDYSNKPEFTQAVANKVYYGPVYFRRESEPYMTLSLAGTRRDTGVSIAQVNLKLIWDVVSAIKVGEHGHAYVVDADGRLIAHPDISLVLRNTDMTKLAQVISARAGSASGQVQEADDVAGHRVLTAYAPVNPLGWFVFVETPIEEAYAPLYASIQRTGYVLLAALLLAFIAGTFLARRMVVPIQALRAGAARIGSGDLSQRISIKTGDEVEGLADQFNDMAGRLQESYANLERKVEQRTAELSEALEQQTATSEVLSVISSSPGELQPVFQAMLTNATRICEANFGFMARYDGEAFYRMADVGVAPAYLERIPHGPLRPGSETILGRVKSSMQTVHVDDLAASRGYAERDPMVVAAVEHGGVRTYLGVPMIRNDKLVGVILLYRQEVRLFSDKHVALVQNFAAQAVIAIENTRLLNELRESLEQQTAMSDVLRVISSSPGELEPVFRAVWANVTRLCEAEFGGLFLRTESGFSNVLPHDPNKKIAESWRQAPAFVLSEHPHAPLTQVALTRETVHVADLSKQQAYVERDPLVVRLVESAGGRTLLIVPMFKEGELIGAIAIYRTEVRPFTEKQVELLKNFAAQAVIAIENTRLLSELRESLQQQTATADVLKVISRSTFDLQAVLDTLVESATRLCRAERAAIRLFKGGLYHNVASYGFTPEHKERMEREAVGPGPGSIAGRVAVTRKSVHVVDTETDPDPEVATRSRLGNSRTVLGVPLLREGTPIGVLLLQRSAVQAFTDKEIALAETFADQAVIAIENVRLFEAEQQRTAELSESLEQQTATSEVLKVISSSPGELEPVFNTILENATRICEAKFATLFRFDGEKFYAAAGIRLPEALLRAHEERGAFMPVPGTTLHEVWRTKRTYETEDDAKAPEPGQHVTFGGARSTVGVPMLKDDTLVGVIVIYRQEVRPFTAKQVELVNNFAAQAVIAIENTRLLNELRESLEQQTATADVLRVISTSQNTIQLVFEAVVTNAARLCGALNATIYLRDSDTLTTHAHFGPLSGTTIGEPRPLNRDWVTGRAVLDKRTVQVADLQAGEEFPEAKEMSARFGHRAALAVPLFRDGTVIGAILVRDEQVRQFTDKEVVLVENFAAQAVIAIENTRLLSELRQSLEQQTATADVLRVISSSPGELEPVFQAMLENATRICSAKFGVLFRSDGELFEYAAEVGTPPELAEFLVRRGPFRPAPGTQLNNVIRTKQVSHTADYAVDAPDSAPAKLGRARSTVDVPMLKDGALVGAISVYRQEVRPFTDKQIELLTNFAAQAVIAIENTRLLSELRQSLEQQTATADVLKVISSSPGDLEPVFNAMLENAARICDAKAGNIYRWDGEALRLVASHNTPPAFVEFIHRSPIRPTTNNPVGHMLRAKSPIHVADLSVQPQYIAKADPTIVAAVDLGGVRTLLTVPMVKENELVGAFTLWREEVRPFADKQVDLVKNFAAQAVIAIENTRLLSELRQSLEQQTATADVLRVISSSPGELEPVFRAMLENAVRICEAKFGTLFRYDNKTFDPVAQFGAPPALAEFLRQRGSFQPPARSPLDRLLQTKDVVRIADDLAEPVPGASAKFAGARSVIVVPMLKDSALVGAIVIYRQEVLPFTEKQIELVKNFAAQAVIAIENTRLLSELHQRTDDLSQSLEQQTATSDVLEVISRSAFDLKAVFDTVAESSVRLCGADRAFIFRFDGELLRMAAAYNSAQEFIQWVAQHPIRPGRHSGAARAALEHRTIHIPDVRADPEYTYGAKDAEAIRTVLGVPILKGDELLGVMMIYHLEVRPFTDKQIALVETFADQAAIAIENVRLFEDVQKRTEELSASLEQQTATSEVLKIISRSTFDLQTVLDTLVESAARLCEADKASINRAQDDGYRAVAVYGFTPEFRQYMEEHPVIPTGKGSVVGRTVMAGETVQVTDVTIDPDYRNTDMIKAGNVRTLLGVPMLREGAPTGVLVLMRSEVKPFTEKQIELAQTFADQAVIAVENVRLFEEIQDKSRQVEEASQHKSQFLANMSHELRTPLNAILGYTELILDDIYGEAPEKMRNVLQRIATNGKHLLGLINDVLDLSKIEAGQLVLTLNDYSIKDMMQGVYVAVEPLAGNKKLGFKLEAPPDLPRAHGDERRLSQVLLNLVGNAIKFTDTGEVAMKATAANGSYRISVRDTGPGIAEADQAKIFEEFQQSESAQTKAKGGTGLGLSIAKRIVEMHGGKLWVESSLGSGSTFFVELPLRAEQQAGKA